MGQPTQTTSVFALEEKPAAMASERRLLSAASKKMLETRQRSYPQAIAIEFISWKHASVAQEAAPREWRLVSILKVELWLVPKRSTIASRSTVRVEGIPKERKETRDSISVCVIAFVSDLI